MKKDKLRVYFLELFLIIIFLFALFASNILNRKVSCRKVVAFCIVKYLDDNDEIEDYFEKMPQERIIQIHR